LRLRASASMSKPIRRRRRLLEPYRPFFIVIALVALFFAWRSIYQPTQACKPGEVCALPPTRRLYKFLFWASAVLTLLALVYPYFARYFY
jgi:mercuric ion transport protein